MLSQGCASSQTRQLAESDSARRNLPAGIFCGKFRIKVQSKVETCKMSEHTLTFCL